METLITNEQQRHKVKKAIELELLKRGIKVEIPFVKEVQSKGREINRLEFTSTEFQTTPIIFKTILVTNFSSWLTKEPNNERLWSFNMAIHVSYQHFDGGSNGCRLFGIKGYFLAAPEYAKDEQDSEIYGITITV